MKFNEIRSEEELEELVKEIGFLPFFKNEIRGFSIEEMTPASLWFTDQPGPWEWKGSIALRKKVVYGKFFRKKAGFVSLKWFPDFANYRRDGYDLDALYDEGHVPEADKNLYDLIVAHRAIDTRTLKAISGYGGKEGKKGFETILTRLQMESYVNIRNFIYATDSQGDPYGWGISQYTTPEEMFSAKTVDRAYHRDPIESRERMVKHLQSVFGDSYEDLIRRLLQK